MWKVLRVSFGFDLPCCSQQIFDYTGLASILRRSLFLVFLVGLFSACSEEKSPSNNQPKSCSTESFWLNGDEESPLMHPGGNCTKCHAGSGEGPAYVIAGTVQGAASDNIDCNGLAGAVITLTDSSGVTKVLASNAAGNFFSSTQGDLTGNYTASVTHNGITKKMVSSQSDFNCANCHADGANVTGRIFVAE